MGRRSGEMRAGCHGPCAAGVSDCVSRTGHLLTANDDYGQRTKITENSPDIVSIEEAAAPSGKLLGRAQAARLLGVSKSTLRRMEGASLEPVLGPRNVRLFHEEQIQSLLVTRRSEVAGGRPDGELAAETFELFDAGVHPVDVVKKLRVDPDLIESLHQRWARLRAMLVLSTSGVQSLCLSLSEAEVIAAPKSESELLGLVTKWVQEMSLRECTQCNKNPAAFCRECAKAWGVRAVRQETAMRRSNRL